MKRTRGETTFMVINTLFLVCFAFFTLYPFWAVVVHSLNEAADSVKGNLWFFPRKPTLDNYKFIFANNGLLSGFIISVGRTVVGTSLSVLLMSMFSYALTRRGLILGTFFSRAVTFTMFFSGGLIPFYLLIRDLGLINNPLVYVIPFLFAPYYIIIIRTFFLTNIPDSLEEAAKIDGCNDLIIFFRIVLPISTPILATIALFVAVWHWNDWFTGYIYMMRADLIPLQTYLMKIINEALSHQLLSSTLGQNAASTVSGEAVRNAVMVVVTIPIILVYPFLQKYFVKGVLIGSVKG